MCLNNLYRYDSSSGFSFFADNILVSPLPYAFHKVPEFLSRILYCYDLSHNILQLLTKLKINIIQMHLKVNPVRRPFALLTGMLTWGIDPVFARKGTYFHPSCKQWAF